MSTKEYSPLHSRRGVSLPLCAHVGLTDCDTDGPGGLRAEGVARERERERASVVSPAERFVENVR